MVEITIHDQPMMNGRIDTRCPSCGSKTAHYPHLPTSYIGKCGHCGLMLPNGIRLYRDKEVRVNWHVFAPLVLRK